MANYNASTRARIADINRGMLVETATLDATAALVSTAKSLFTVYGRIRVLSLDMEVITVLGADATTLTFAFDPSSPAIAAIDISGASGSLANGAVGLRATLSGTALNTAVILAANATVSLSANATMDLGCVDGVGVITSTGGTADATSGTVRFYLTYVPITDGAYAVAA